MKNNQQESLAERLVFKYVWLIAVIVTIMIVWTPDVEVIGTFIYNVIN